MEYLQEEQLIIALAGRQRQMRLVPIRALDQTDTEWIKVADTKGCIVFATGVMRPTPTSSASYCLCVAVKRQVIIYEITRLKTRHARLREVLLPAQAQSLDVFSDGRLCVGYQVGAFNEIMLKLSRNFTDTSITSLGSRSTACWGTSTRCPWSTPTTRCSASSPTTRWTRSAPSSCRAGSFSWCLTASASMWICR